MKRKFLEDLGLTKEQIDSVMAENGKDIEAEKEKAATTTAELEDAKNQLKEANSTITDLKKNNSDNETLQTKVKEYENTIKTQKAEYETKVREMSIKSAIQGKLTDTKYPELLETKFDKTKLTVSEDGKVLGIDEQLKELKQTYKDLFTPKIEGRDPYNAGGASKGMTKEQFKELGYKERVELFNTNKELYDSLSKED